VLFTFVCIRAETPLFLWDYSHWLAALGEPDTREPEEHQGERRKRQHEKDGGSAQRRRQDVL
jgi:hypothetical protein